MPRKSPRAKEITRFGTAPSTIYLNKLTQQSNYHANSPVGMRKKALDALLKPAHIIRQASALAATPKSAPVLTAASTGTPLRPYR
jgi:hypothetical protein